MASIEIKIGEITIGGDSAISVQSMTNTDTNDVEKTVEQCKKLFAKGCKLVRITVPSIKEVSKIKQTKELLLANNYTLPIVADIHYKPELALKLAGFIDKIRINPGNYIDKKLTDEKLAYIKLEQNFLPLLKECKKHNTVLRIGSNFGSLSERILQKYGNSPLGMVESISDFINICKKNNFNNVVVSMKASDPRIMVSACRQIQNKMKSEGLIYPQHLGVTEAGNGKEARIKTTVGMATLLSEGIGDTIRVSLTENPENEVPVAEKIINYFNYKNNSQTINSNIIDLLKRDYTINKSNKYITISQFTDDFSNSNTKPDFIFTNNYNNVANNNLQYICDFEKWENSENVFPMFSPFKYFKTNTKSAKYNFIFGEINDFSPSVITKIENDKTAIIILNTNSLNNIFELRNNYNNFIKNVKTAPIILYRKYSLLDDNFLIKSAGEIGSILVDKLCGGVWLENTKETVLNTLDTSYTIFQATKVRITKTEFISCPTCGRTKFNIEDITNQIKEKTSHFKGLKIAVMGCVVNGPGEMLDADYGYVGAGKNLVHLYKQGVLIQKNIPQENAVDELVRLINSDQK